MKNKQVIQKHHIRYGPDEITVNLYKGEHWVITQLNRRTKTVSKGFIRCVKEWIKKAELIAIELD